MIFKILGWVSIGVAAYYALRMNILDRRMQQYRPENARPMRYAFVPLRWQQDFYTQEGHAIVGQAWGAFGKMVGFFLLGVVFMAVGY